jgi:hypothetical protein
VGEGQVADHDLDILAHFDVLASNIRRPVDVVVRKHHTFIVKVVKNFKMKNSRMFV